MLHRLPILSAIFAAYGLFWAWYTGSRKPLTQHEIETYLAEMETMEPDPVVLKRLRSFLESDTGKSFVMVNLIKLRDKPLSQSTTQPMSESASTTLQRYTSTFLPSILKQAGHPILVGKAAAEAVELWGVDQGDTWTNVGLVRYRSRRDMIKAVMNPRFAEVHPFKQAAIEKTIAVPADPWFHLGDPRLVVGLFACIALLITVRTKQKSAKE